MNLNVCESFTSMQGEGPRVGEITFFLRLSGCDLCCPFCDTKYSWASGRETNIMEIAKEFQASPAKTACITGGEPLLQLDAVCALSQFIPCVTMETSGLHLELLGGKRWKYIEEFVISPKLTVKPAGEFLKPWKTLPRQDAREILSRSSFKFVIETTINKQVDEALQFVEMVIETVWGSEQPKSLVPCYFQVMDDPKYPMNVVCHQSNHRVLWLDAIKQKGHPKISIRVLPQLHKMLNFK